MSIKSDWSAAYEYAKQYGGTDYYNYIGSPEYWNDLRHQRYISELNAKKESERRKQEQQEERDLQSALMKIAKRESLIGFLEENEVSIGYAGYLPKDYLDGDRNQYNIDGIGARYNLNEEIKEELSNTVKTAFKKIEKSLERISKNITENFYRKPLIIIINNQYEITITTYKSEYRIETIYNIREKNPVTSKFEKNIIRCIKCKLQNRNQKPTYHYSIEGPLFIVRFNSNTGGIDEIDFDRSEISKQKDKSLTLPIEIKLYKYSGRCEFIYEAPGSLTDNEMINIYRKRIYHFRRFLCALNETLYNEEDESRYWKYENNIGAYCRGYDFDRFLNKMSDWYGINQFELQPYDKSGDFESLLKTWEYDIMRVLDIVKYQKPLDSSNSFIIGTINLLDSLLIKAKSKTKPDPESESLLKKNVSSLPYTSYRVNPPSIDYPIVLE